MPELSIVIPFYNEEDNARNVITCLEQVLRKVDYEIVAVDNGSFDMTGEILRSIKSRRLKIVKVEKNVGFGFGVISGLKAAKGAYVGYMWGDNQISPSVVLDVFKKLKEEGMDLCKIKRMARDYSFFRKLESGFYNRLFMRILFGKITNDVNGSPKIMKRGIYERLRLESKDWFIDTEVMVKCKCLNARVGEVSAVYAKRRVGKSKVKFYIAMEFLKNMLKFRFGSLRTFKNSTHNV